MPLHFAVQFRDGCPIPGASLTPMDGEYVLVSNSYSDDILGGMPDSTPIIANEILEKLWSGEDFDLPFESNVNEDGN